MRALLPILTWISLTGSAHAAEDDSAPKLVFHATASAVSESIRVDRALSAPPESLGLPQVTRLLFVHVQPDHPDSSFVREFALDLGLPCGAHPLPPPPRHRFAASLAAAYGESIFVSADSDPDGDLTVVTLTGRVEVLRRDDARTAVRLPATSPRDICPVFPGPTASRHRAMVLLCREKDAPDTQRAVLCTLERGSERPLVSEEHSLPLGSSVIYVAPTGCGYSIRRGDTGAIEHVGACTALWPEVPRGEWISTVTVRQSIATVISSDSEGLHIRSGENSYSTALPSAQCRGIALPLFGGAGLGILTTTPRGGIAICSWRPPQDPVYFETDLHGLDSWVRGYTVDGADPQYAIVGTGPVPAKSTDISIYRLPKP